MADRSKELQACKKVIKENELPPESAMILEREDLPVIAKIMDLVMAGSRKLSLLETMFDNVDLLELKGREFVATKSVVHEVFNLLDAAESLYCSTH